jgi:hypothetical protein
MTRSGRDGVDGGSGRAVVMSAVLLAGALLASCSPNTASPPAASDAASVPTLGAAVDVPAKQAVQQLRGLFTAAGVNPDAPQQLETTLRLTACPLGASDQLISTPPAPVAGLGSNPAYFLRMSRDGVPGVRCTFTTDQNGAFLQYQATYVPPAQLQSYVGLLDSEGFEQSDNGLFGGAMYSHCEEPGTATSTSAGADSGDCSAIWLNGVIVVGLRYSGPGGKSADVTSWLKGMIDPMVTSLAAADATALGVATPATNP